MKSTTRIRGLLAALFLALGAAGLWGVAGVHDASLPQGVLQQAIDGALPKEITPKGAVKTLVRAVVLRAARIEVKDGKTAVVAELDGELRNGKSFAIAARALGTPVYAEGALYLSPEAVEVSRLTYNGETAAERVARVARGHVASEAARAVVEEQARKADDWAQSTAEAALRLYLAERPVYRLKDDETGAAVKATLKGVAVAGDRIVVTYSLWRITDAALGGALSLAVGLILAALVVRAILRGEVIEFSAD
jgi:hypothetical protein